jgi:hypothetical protein
MQYSALLERDHSLAAKSNVTFCPVFWFLVPIDWHLCFFALEAAYVRQVPCITMGLCIFGRYTRASQKKQVMPHVWH